jgi:hypothetical protein
VGRFRLLSALPCSGIVRALETFNASLVASAVLRRSIAYVLRFEMFRKVIGRADCEERPPVPSDLLDLYGSACYQQLEEAALAQIATPSTSNRWVFGQSFNAVKREDELFPPWFCETLEPGAAELPP